MQAKNINCHNSVVRKKLLFLYTWWCYPIDNTRKSSCPHWARIGNYSPSSSHSETRLVWDVYRLGIETSYSFIIKVLFVVYFHRISFLFLFVFIVNFNFFISISFFIISYCCLCLWQVKKRIIYLSK